MTCIFARFLGLASLGHRLRCNRFALDHTGLHEDTRLGRRGHENNICQIVDQIRPINSLSRSLAYETKSSSNLYVRTFTATYCVSPR